MAKPGLDREIKTYAVVRVKVKRKLRCFHSLQKT